MTPTEAHALAAQVHLGSVFYGVRFEVEPVLFEAGAVHVFLRWQVLDRDHGFPTNIQLIRTVRIEEMTETTFLNMLRGMLHEAARHEADEALSFKGERVFDPHANDMGARL